MDNMTSSHQQVIVGFLVKKEPFFSSVLIIAHHANH